WLANGHTTPPVSVLMAGYRGGASYENCWGIDRG
ncbi:unnamed protein product, partial [marine sediment metagenome]